MQNNGINCSSWALAGWPLCGQHSATKRSNDDVCISSMIMSRRNDSAFIRITLQTATRTAYVNVFRFFVELRTRINPNYRKEDAFTLISYLIYFIYQAHEWSDLLLRALATCFYLYSVKILPLFFCSFYFLLTRNFASIL